MIFKSSARTAQACQNTENLLLVFEMLDGSQTLEGPIDHDGQSSAEGLTLLHTGGKQPQSIFILTALLLLFRVYEKLIVIYRSLWQTSTKCQTTHDFVLAADPTVFGQLLRQMCAAD